MQGRPPFARGTVQAWRPHLEASRRAPATINHKLSGIRKLAAEATYAGLLDPSVGQAIREIKGARLIGVRTGNWLTKAQAEAILQAPDLSTLQGKRDRAMLTILIGCGLRRDEATRLNISDIAQRDGRWCLVDVKGKTHVCQALL